jgi:hypothetical protein
MTLGSVVEIENVFQSTIKQLEEDGCKKSRGIRL